MSRRDGVQMTHLILNDILKFIPLKVEARHSLNDALKNIPFKIKARRSVNGAL